MRWCSGDDRNDLLAAIQSATKGALRSVAAAPAPAPAAADPNDLMAQIRAAKQVGCY
jgi:hypothetical protein|eukprot:SAG25_NODE_752_length_5570_cov_9.068726_6_plen_57_part_00